MPAHSPRDIDWFDMEEIPYRASRLLKALGNPKTYALARLLLEKDVLTVEQMARALKRSQPTISKILRTLRDLEVVRYQRKGNEVYYTLKDKRPLGALLDEAEHCTGRAAEKAGGRKRQRSR